MVLIFAKLCIDDYITQKKFVSWLEIADSFNCFKEIAMYWCILTTMSYFVIIMVQIIIRFKISAKIWAPFYMFYHYYYYHLSI